MAHTRLTPALEQTILAYIRAGGYPHVAAEAAGVPRAAFDHWLRLGQRRSGPARYRRFHLAVCQAAAQARLGAEIAILQKRPLDWLKCGQGKAPPGWTSAARAPVAPAGPHANLLMAPEMQQLIGALLRLLAPFPEARAAVAEALAASPTTDVE